MHFLHHHLAGVSGKLDAPTALPRKGSQYPFNGTLFGPQRERERDFGQFREMCLFSAGNRRKNFRLCGLCPKHYTYTF